jgi:hypothetical protein
MWDIRYEIWDEKSQYSNLNTQIYNKENPKDEAIMWGLTLGRGHLVAVAVVSSSERNCHCN